MKYSCNKIIIINCLSSCGLGYLVNEPLIEVNWSGGGKTIQCKFSLSLFFSNYWCDLLLSTGFHLPLFVYFQSFLTAIQFYNK